MIYRCQVFILYIFHTSRLAQAREQTVNHLHLQDFGIM
jgi:hypothetical protein